MLQVDVQRSMLADTDSATGIKLSAELAGAKGMFDLVTLQRESVLAFLRHRGGDNVLAENIVLLLLGHPRAEPKPEGARIISIERPKCYKCGRTFVTGEPIASPRLKDGTEVKVHAKCMGTEPYKPEEDNDE